MQLLPLIAWLAAAAPAPAQGTPPDGRHWMIRTSLFLSGTSDRSDPAGYTVYSGLGIAAAVSRAFGPLLRAELSVRTESRELDQDQPIGYLRLGSLEMVPLTLMLQLRASGGKVQPYLGGGANVTMAWEKSGVLDTLDVAHSVGPAVQAGADIRVSPAVVVNADITWYLHRTGISAQGARIVSLRLDPLVLSAGVGFRLP
jgi:outer membrane protein